MLGVWVVLQTQSGLESCREDGTYCASVPVLPMLQSYIPATVGVSSCHRVTQAQLDSGDISASTAANMVNIGTKEFLIRE